MNKVVFFFALVLSPFIMLSQSISSLSPSSSASNKTLDVTITGNGTHFSSGSPTSVEFKFISGSITYANSITVVNETSLIANITISSVSDGNYDVSVINTIDGTVTLTRGFTITNPQLSSITPSSANAGETLDVTITGSNTHFNSGSGTDVSFLYQQGTGSSINVNSINISSETSLVANVTVPSNSYTGDFQLNINNDIDGRLSLSSAFHVDGVTPPTLSSISPANASDGETLDVTITGLNTHFISGSGTGVSFNFGSGSWTVNSLTINNETSLIANMTVPSNINTGNYSVHVNNSIDGSIVMYSAFHVDGVDPGTLSTISPASANPGETLDVTITGLNTHFSSGSGTAVSFGFGSGTSTVNSLTINSETSIVANITVPSSTNAGNYNLNVYNNADGHLSLYSGFQVNRGLNNNKVQLSPVRAKAGETLNVTITGTNTRFRSGSGTSAKFDFNQASGTTVVNNSTITSDTEMTANITVPSSASVGKYQVTMTNTGVGTLVHDFYVYDNCFSYFEADYDEGNNSFALTLDSETSNLGTSFYWDFGDGGTSTGETPSHTYIADGIYDVCLTVTVGSGETCTYCHQIGKDSEGNIIRLSGFTMDIVRYDGTKSPVGINETDSKTSVALVISPNPFSIETTVNINREIQEGTIRIVDVVGKEVSTMNFSGSQVKFNREDLPSGLYFIQIIENGNILVNEKVIIE